MHTDTDVLIIGTGFSGLGMAIKMLDAGMQDFIVLESASAVGGTWRDNHYPGVACDVPAHLYSYSFEPNPSWSQVFAPQREILAYLNKCADKYGVRPHIHFDSEVVRAVFDEKRGQWEISTKNGKTYRARALICGGGGLSRPTFPELRGLDRFQGKKFHTARWDHDYPLQGKRVAVIGTGASAIQLVPSIVDQVGGLALFQRTPPWILPKPDLAISKKQQARFAKSPWLQKLIRGAMYGLLESRALGFSGMLPSFQVGMERQARKHLEAQVTDPVLRAKLTPNYRAGCKRVLLSNDYYTALQKSNASVVTARISELREHSIVTDDGVEHPVDAIVFATGFQAAEAVAPFEIRGRDKAELGAAWTDGAEAYYGSTIAGFPNLFLLVGPNTGLGHNSMVYMIESQIQYVVDGLARMRDRGAAWVDVKRSVQDSYNKELSARLDKTVWKTGGCVSWYHTKTGKNTTLWPSFTFEFRRRTRHFELNDYELRMHESTRLPKSQPSAAGTLDAHPAE
jgi:cation diffusion facilitator CzcD-associated flavoprotein CzcO